MEDEYVNGNKYLKKLTNEDEEEIYRAWKQSKNNLWSVADTISHNL